jgi:hypothetical protein
MCPMATAMAAVMAETMPAAVAATRTAAATEMVEGTDVGILKDGYILIIPLPRAPQVQSASLVTRSTS